MLGAPSGGNSLIQTRQSWSGSVRDPTSGSFGTSIQTPGSEAWRVNPDDSLRDFGVIFDCELIMRPRINIRSCRCDSFISVVLKLQRIDSTPIISLLDYCNTVYVGLPAVTIASLRRDLNASARLVAGLGVRDSVSEAMKSLHWLPVVYRIRYTLCLMMYAFVYGQNQDYTVHIIKPICALSGHVNLPSAAQELYDIPRTRARFVDRAFFVAGL